MLKGAHEAAGRAWTGILNSLYTKCANNGMQWERRGGFVVSKKRQIQEIARQIRRDIVTMTHAAGSGHPGGSLSAADLLAALYFTDQFRCDPHNPGWDERDRFILSKGHTAPVIYSVLCAARLFPTGRAADAAQIGFAPAGTPQKGRNARFGLFIRFAGTGAFGRKRHGFCFAPPRIGCACLLPDGRRRITGRSGLGGGDVRAPARAGQCVCNCGL